MSYLFNQLYATNVIAEYPGPPFIYLGGYPMSGASSKILLWASLLNKTQYNNFVSNFASAQNMRILASQHNLMCNDQVWANMTCGGSTTHVLYSSPPGGVIQNLPPDTTWYKGVLSNAACAPKSPPGPPISPGQASPPPAPPPRSPPPPPPNPPFPPRPSLKPYPPDLRPSPSPNSSLPSNNKTPPPPPPNRPKKQ